ncbi:PREDICTED: major royal jelly protein 1-like [Cyphomyrmex costatus]|uniref:major royal jelly protein 1-like n=1 Tax=Cyphomyrmex costatus TaxID=456900 RepID=UPI0008524218|nr:PREDICTED: major royal jelly protein 1-like [Cyphomyrmex costatus]
MKRFLLVIPILSMTTTSFGKSLLKYEWKYLDILWDSPRQKEEAIYFGRYNPNVAFLYDIDKADDGRVFITAMRDKGIPVGVLTITEKQGEGGPLLRPYPDWSWYKDDCEGITGGVYQVQIICNHLFVVDEGRIGDDQLCLPQLLIFELSTDKLVKRVTIPFNIAHNKTGIGLIASVAVFAPYCQNVKDNAIVFIGDVEGGGLVVYNGYTSKLCRVESDFMKSTHEAIVLTNERYPNDDTVYGMTIIDEDLYYVPFAGSKMYKTKMSNLIECSPKDINEANKETQLVGSLEGQTVAITSNRCVIFFSDITKTSVMCADATKEINSKNKEIVAYDPKMEFISGMKIRNGELLVLSNRYHLHVYNVVYNNNTFDSNEVNFRVLSIPIAEIEKNTKCFSSCKILRK